MPAQVLVAARRVVDVLDTVELMAKNVDKLLEGKDLVESRMQRLIELLREFHAAVGAFGELGWMKSVAEWERASKKNSAVGTSFLDGRREKDSSVGILDGRREKDSSGRRRAWRMRGHLDTLQQLDKRIVEQLRSFRDTYRLAADTLLMDRTYQIEQSIEALVAQRVRETGESRDAAAEALSEDPVAISSVAVDANASNPRPRRHSCRFRLARAGPRGGADGRAAGVPAGGARGHG